jgi:hypothetical protein
VVVGQLIFIAIVFGVMGCARLMKLPAAVVHRAMPGAAYAIA